PPPPRPPARTHANTPSVRHPLQHCCHRLAPVIHIRRLRDLLRSVTDTGRIPYVQHARRYVCGKNRRIVTRPGGEYGNITNRTSHMAPQPGIELHTIRIGFFVQPHRTTLHGRTVPRTLRDLRHHVPRTGTIGNPGIQPEIDSCGNDIRPAGPRYEPAHSGTSIRIRHRDPAGRGNHRCSRNHRIGTIPQRRRPRMIALPLYREPPPPVRNHRATERNRRAPINQTATLLDMQLDERADTRQRHIVTAQQLRCQPLGSDSLGQRHPVRIPQCTSPVGIQRPRQQPRPETRHTEPAALLLRKRDNRHRPRHNDPPSTQPIHCGKGTHHPERSVKSTPTRDGIEMTARHHRIVTRTGPPRPQIAVTVRLDIQPTPRRLFPEPLPQRQLGRLENMPRVTTTTPVDSHIVELCQQPCRTRSVRTSATTIAHAPSSILRDTRTRSARTSATTIAHAPSSPGTRTPRARATSTASS